MLLATKTDDRMLRGQVRCEVHNTLLDGLTDLTIAPRLSDCFSQHPICVSRGHTRHVRVRQTLRNIFHLNVILFRRQSVMNK